MNSLKTICYSVCPLSIAAAGTLCLLAVWGGIEGDTVWRASATAAILGTASAGIALTSDYFRRS